MAENTLTDFVEEVAKHVGGRRMVDERDEDFGRRVVLRLRERIKFYEQLKEDLAKRLGYASSGDVT